jgi:hypothetical protein
MPALGTAGSLALPGEWSPGVSWLPHAHTSGALRVRRLMTLARARQDAKNRS